MPEDTDVFYVLTRKPSVPEFVGTGKHTVFEIAHGRNYQSGQEVIRSSVRLKRWHTQKMV